MSDGKLKSRPPTNNDISLDEFLGSAGTQTQAAEKARPDWWSPERSEEPPPAPEPGPYPWEAPGVREDITRVFNLRLTEPYFLKLKYIAEHSPVSMQKFCLEILLPAIDAKIDKLIKP